jgi:hypothetical protein
MVDHLRIAEHALEAYRRTARVDPPLETLLKGLAIELWSPITHSIWLVADDEDAQRLMHPRSEVYTAEEFRQLLKLPSATAAEVHTWKQSLSATITCVRRQCSATK